MKRDERQQLHATTEMLDSWVELATTVRAERAEITKAATTAEAALRRAVVEVRHGNKVAWRVMPLRAKDAERLRDIARHARLAPVSKILDESLTDLTTSVAAAIRNVKVVTGAQRFFSRGNTRQKGIDAAEYVVAYQNWFTSNRLPDALKRLAEQDAKVPGKVPLLDALAEEVGLARRVANLGRDAVVVQGNAFVGLRQAITKLQSIAADEARCRSSAVEAGNAVRRAETERLVADMAVDRLKEATRDKIRTGPLTDAGLSTVRAVLEYRGLQNLPGIGPTLATRIQGAAQTLWQTTYDEMPARIDVKNRTTATTQLLRSLRTWDAMRKNIGGTADLELTQEFNAFAKTLDGAVTPAIVFCAPHSSVDDFRGSVDAIVLRAQLISDAYGLSQKGDPWDDFLARPADYFALLAELGFITEDAEKAHGDLSDEIVEAVRALELKTEYLSASLRGYQSFGARFALVQRKVIIGDEMGLGKTVEAIAVLSHLRAKGSHHFLVICPAAVVTNWVREVSSKSKLRAHRVHGFDRAPAARSWIRNGGVAITTFETLAWLLSQNATDLDDVKCVVIDEAHYIKNPDAQRTRNSLLFLNSSDHSVLLTGTPLENRIDEFRNLISYLRPDLLVDANELAPRKFRRQVAPAYLRRNQEDVLTELPGMVEVDEWLGFSGEDSAAYREAVTAGNFMAMRQAAMAQGSRSMKMQRLVEIVEEAEENGRRVVVFSYFRDILDQVANALPGRVFGPLTGSVAAVKRQTMVDDFSAAGHGAVLVAQIVAGGVGLNIQAASVVVICEPQLKPTTEWQAIARARRMGQLESVQVHRLLSDEGVDQRIREILARKSEIFEEFARVSETADSAPEAYDVSEADLARDIVAAERERLFAPPGLRKEEPRESAASNTALSPRPPTKLNDVAFSHVQQPKVKHHEVAAQPYVAPLVTSSADAGPASDLSYSMKDIPSAKTDSHVANASAVGTSRLKPYITFRETLPALDSTPLAVVAANVARIVSVEGPILGRHLHEAYIRAAGASAARSEVSRILNRAITLAERRSQIVSDNPLRGEGVKPKTFRLPNQPKVLPRQLGSRTLELIPPGELAHQLTQLAAKGGKRSQQSLFRELANLYGMTQLTPEGEAALFLVYKLVSAQGQSTDDRDGRTMAATKRNDVEPKSPTKSTPREVRRARSPFYDTEFVDKREQD